MRRNLLLLGAPQEGSASSTCRTNKIKIHMMARRGELVWYSGKVSSELSERSFEILSTYLGLL